MDEIIYSNLATKNTCTGVRCCVYQCLAGGYYTLTDDPCLAEPGFYACADSLPDGGCNEGDSKTIDCTPI